MFLLLQQFINLTKYKSCVYFRLKKKEDRRRQQYHLASNGEVGAELGGTLIFELSYDVKMP